LDNHCEIQSLKRWWGGSKASNGLVEKGENCIVFIKWWLDLPSLAGMETLEIPLPPAYGLGLTTTALETDLRKFNTTCGL